jgi:hypothetical protein
MAANGGDATLARMSRLIAHVIDGHLLEIRPAPLEREWMEATGRRFAYRCLPVNIANGHGWEILCPAPFEAEWDGGPERGAVHIRPDPDEAAPALSHFGYGVLTLPVPCVFETDPGVDLFVTGPLNRPKDAISPLTGVIETDWSPYSFTMNWVFTRPHAPVRFERGEPYCHIFPLERGRLEAVSPQQSPLSDAPELGARYEQWSRSRNDFNAELMARTRRCPDDWQKSYFRGEGPSGEAAAVNGHRRRLRLKPFT